MKPDLKFGPATERKGFTSSGTSQHNDLKPARVVRELIQNSLDAAAKAEREQAIVKFETFSIQTSEIPGIKSFEKKFKAAKREHKVKKGGCSKLNCPRYGKCPRSVKY